MAEQEPHAASAHRHGIQFRPVRTPDCLSARLMETWIPDNRGLLSCRAALLGRRPWWQGF